MTGAGVNDAPAFGTQAKCLVYAVGSGTDVADWNSWIYFGEQ